MKKTGFTITFENGESHTRYLTPIGMKDGIWLDNDGKKLQLSNGLTKNAFFGESVNLQIETFNITDGKKLDIRIKAKIGDEYIEEFEELNYKLEVKNNLATLNNFYLDPKWYNEEIETYYSKDETVDGYDFKAHQTGVNPKESITFVFEAKFEDRDWDKARSFPKDENDYLKPVTYRRNYEEYIGLYKYENLTNKHSEKRDLTDNYENEYISKNTEILMLVNSFSEFITQKGLQIEGDENKGIKERVEKDAKKLWLLSVKQLQNDDYNDRTLYWARNKMQVWLKRHPLFKKDINFVKSTVNPNTPLNEIIILFEELSRNYNDINFSGITNKKLLITGFDPFILDPTRGGNPLQSNPSGINALALHGKTIGDYYIQTFIAPVRYKDFDEFKEGEGIIEKFVTPFITEVDMIITVSQGGVFRFDVDRFPAKNRGGYKDNMLWGTGAGNNKTSFKQLTIGGEEFYKTTLPYRKIVPNVNNPSDTFWVYFNQTFEAVGKDYPEDHIQGTQLIEDVSDGTPENNCIINDFKELQSLQSVSGSGSNYLSNEIFYRVAKLRTQLKPDLQTGHLHVPLTQYGRSFPDSRDNIVTIDINPKMKELIDKIKEIITKI